MVSFNLSLPERLSKFVQKRSRETAHSDTNAYIRSLIREDEKRAKTGTLEDQLIEGLDSGAPIDATSKEWWSKKRASLLKKINGKRRR